MARPAHRPDRHGHTLSLFARRGAGPVVEQPRTGLRHVVLLDDGRPSAVPTPRPGPASRTGTGTGQHSPRRADPGPDLPRTVAEAAAAMADAPSGRTAVIAFDRPTESDLREVGDLLSLHPVLMEDLLHGRQRPKLERYGDTLFVVLRAAAYLDDPEDIVFAELHVVVRDGWVVVVVRHGEPGEADWDFDGFRQPSDLLRHGPQAILYALIDTVVDGYFRVLDGVSIDVEEIERQVFSGDTAVPQRIYRLSREVVDLQHATAPLVQVVAGLRATSESQGADDRLHAYLQDAEDHLSRVNTRVTEIRDVLGQILTVNATLVGQRQNEDMKTISAWAAILFTPTLVGAVYGMNFDRMPELHWAFGYPAALATMVLLGVGLWAVFKVKKWL